MDSWSNLGRLKNKELFGMDPNILFGFLAQGSYPHASRESVSPVCGFFYCGCRDRKINGRFTTDISILQKIQHGVNVMHYLGHKTVSNLHCRKPRGSAKKEQYKRGRYCN